MLVAIMRNFVLGISFGPTDESEIDPSSVVMTTRQSSTEIRVVLIS